LLVAIGAPSGEQDSARPRGEGRSAPVGRLEGQNEKSDSGEDDQQFGHGSNLAFSSS